MTWLEDEQSETPRVRCDRCGRETVSAHHGERAVPREWREYAEHPEGPAHLCHRCRWAGGPEDS